MEKRIVSKKAVKRERNPKKIKKVIKQKGYSKGKLPKGKELHHKKPVARGGKTNKSNTKVVSKAKHKKIHKNRTKRGKI